MIRTRTQALKAAQLRWGKNAAVQDDRRLASTPEQREHHHQEVLRLRALPTPTDPQEQRARREERMRHMALSMRYRYTVGDVGMGIFFQVRGQGDTWQEAMDQADARNHFTRPFPHPIGCADCRKYRQCCTCKARLRGRVAKDGQCADCRTTEGKR